MRYFRALMFTVAVVSMATCKVDAMRADVPAHIDNPTQASRAELLRVVTEALNGRVVTLADSALTDSSLLIIEPKHLSGRDLRKPVHFRLMLNGSQCVLIHQETEARLELTRTQCVAE